MLSCVYKYAYIFFIYINKLSFGNAIFFWRDMVLWETVLCIALKMILDVITGKLVNKSKLKVILQNNGHILFQTINLMKDKEK